MCFICISNEARRKGGIKRPEFGSTLLLSVVSYCNSSLAAMTLIKKKKSVK